MSWKKTKITNNDGKTITVWKNSKGQISYSNPKAVSAAKKALRVSGVTKGLLGIRDTASFLRASLKSGGGSRSGQFLGGDLPKKSKEKEKVDLSPTANKARILAEKNRITQAENEAKLEGLRIDRRSGNNIRTGTRNWSNPYMGPEYEESARLRKKAEIATKKYQEDKFEKETYAGWAEADLQDAIDLGAAIPPDKGGKGGVSESKASGGVKWGTDKKYPLMIGGKKTSQIQRKLIDAGHDPIKLAELMRKHKEKYGNRGFLGIGGR